MQIYFLDPQQERRRVEEVWRSLLADGDYDYFLSWPWVETWLDVAAERRLNVQLAVFSDRGEDVAACFLGRRRRVRRRLIRSRTLFLNATGDRALDNLYVEYNAILTRRRFACSLDQLVRELPGGWDELVMPGLDPRRFPGSVLATEPGSRLAVNDKRQPAYLVDLESVRRRDGDYLSMLGKSTRSQVRRSLRLYRERGEVRLEAPETTAQALEMFTEMLEMHRAAWAQRGRQSNFDTPCVTGFHYRLIERRFEAGDIQLLRLRVGDETVGCLYNLVQGGQVYCYQSGFRFETDNRLKPGLVCHVEAVLRNARAGASYYNFLAGEDRYKANLATDCHWLHWVTVQQPRVLLAFERWLRVARNQTDQQELGTAPVFRVSARRHA